MAQEKKEPVVMRMSTNLKNRLNTLANKRRTTLTAITNEAIKKYLDSEEYNFEDLLNIVDKIPALKFSRQKIIEEMQNCPPNICKQIIWIIEDKNVFLYEEKNLKDLEERIKKIEKKNLSGIFIHLTSKEEINKVNESLQIIGEILKDTKINLGVSMKSNSHDKILLFVAYNKKEREVKKESE